ncbi:hypothetical protein SAMN05216268_11634 [Streptomyces yunnanensis]|uniref:Uncharacterized protein n=1 Tax=Streptomyces yunnanensis TaxID=156453 RepID=A0A9X8N475_9ACTN|nr:hypothetical protein SAMN05216268_11634 [Streptomyces yunnanensis]
MVASRQPASKRIWHPETGHLNLQLDILFAGETNHWLQLWPPSDEEAATASGSLATKHTKPTSCAVTA